MAANPLTYNQLGLNLLAMLVRQQPTAAVPFFSLTGADAFFLTLYPEAIRYAEARIYRELVLLGQRIVDTSLVTAVANRTLNLLLMTTQIIVPEGFALITPAGTTTPSLGTRVPYDEASLDVIDELWPTESAVATPSISDFFPRYWALQDANTLVFCPSADAIYTVAITGLFQPNPLSATTTTTYLSTAYPELLEAACMVYLVGAILKNFGAQSGDPSHGLSWEGETQKLMALAKSEEHRRRGLMPPVAPPAGRTGS